MKDKWNIRVDSANGAGDLKQLDIKRITLVCHQGMMEVQNLDDDVVTITAEDTVNRAKALTLRDWDGLRNDANFCDLFKQVFDTTPPNDLITSTTDVRHVVGMIMLLAETVAAGKVPFIKLPETYLHPAHCAGLASMLMKLTGGGDEVHAG